MIGDFYKILKNRQGEVLRVPHYVEEIESSREIEEGFAYVVTRTPYITSMYGQIESAGQIEREMLTPFRDNKKDRELLAKLKTVQVKARAQQENMFQIAKASRERTK